MAECVMSLRSQTVAERVRRLASAEKIRADIVSVDPKLTRRGCSVGIRISCDEVERVKLILDKRKIPYGDIFGRGGM